MALSVQQRQVGDIVVLACSGPIAEGPATAQLEKHVAGLLPHQPFIVLNLEGVTFLDSSGLGLLVRLLARTRRAGGGLVFCALPPRVSEILKMTRLQATLASFATESDAVAALYENVASQDLGDFHTDILCVDSSADVLAYLRALLGEAGYRVTTAANIYDAHILLGVIKPRLLVVGAAVRAMRGTKTAEAFREQADRLGALDLESGFSSEDAGEAGQRLLARIGTILQPRT